jgi:hypothetical protein
MKTPREILLKRHKSAEPKLAQMWNESLSTKLRSEGVPARENMFLAVIRTLWRELVLPNPRIWAALTCAWVMIAVLNLASSRPATEVASRAKPPSREEIRALIEQQQMLTQLIGPPSEPATLQKHTSPGPRSDRTGQISAA